MADDNGGGAATGPAVSDWNAGIIAEFRANGAGGRPVRGAPVLLLHTTGARSGLERVNPMMYLDEGGRTYVFASKAGADTNPDWYHNLVAHPEVTVERGSETFAATARPVQRARARPDLRHPGRALPRVRRVRRPRPAGRSPSSSSPGARLTPCGGPAGPVWTPR